MSNMIMKDQLPIIALVGFDNELTGVFASYDFGGRQVMNFDNGMKMTTAWINDNLPIAAIIANSEIMGPAGLTLTATLKKKNLPTVPFFLVINHLNVNLRKLALEGGVTDVFKLPLRSAARVEKRVAFSIENWSQLKDNLEIKDVKVRKTELGKRIFDIVFAGGALIALSPLFLIVYILIRLESKGPAFYYSLRVGTGYKVFKFYKFRSMYVNADKRIKDLKHLNQYNIDAAATNTDEPVVARGLCDDCLRYGKCQYPVFADNLQFCEKEFQGNKKSKSGSAFFKIKNDPRITKVGNFIRNTSIDELPQLWNVIIGDMSIVGNRPLPLYEAEKLTTDKYILRFAAPAGITGLWQVEKRGKGEMSEDERLMLDNQYAQTYSLKNDLKLILKTIPALFQKENV
jgi:lipopolysaccharide/colanic/teichoic acid biosynthesis glycosyltransferase